MIHPKVSIIIPVYNVEKYLPRCMDSLLNQTLTDIEIILVDDESPDNCPAICDEYAKNDNRVRVIHKKNEGQGYARNAGLETATGEYIAFVDSDDYVELNAYQILYSVAKDSKADAVYFNYQRFNDQGNTWMEEGFDKKIWYQTEHDIRGLILDMIANPPKEKNDRDINSSACSALFRQDMIKKSGIKFKSEREFACGEDLLFNFDYLIRSSSVVAIPDALYNYRVNQSSYSRAVQPDYITKMHLFYQYLLTLLRKNNFGTDGYLRATRLVIGYSRFAMRQYVQSSVSKKEKMQWLKEVVRHNYWKEIAVTYPYRQLPFKYTLHFYLFHKGYTRLLYYLSKM